MRDEDVRIRAEHIDFVVPEVLRPMQRRAVAGGGSHESTGSPQLTARSVGFTFSHTRSKSHTPGRSPPTLSVVVSVPKRDEELREGLAVAPGRQDEDARVGEVVDHRLVQRSDERVRAASPVIKLRTLPKLAPLIIAAKEAKQPKHHHSA